MTPESTPATQRETVEGLMALLDEHATAHRRLHEACTASNARTGRIREERDRLANAYTAIRAYAERLASPAACPKCKQTDTGQYGEYACSVCGLPTVWDDPAASQAEVVPPPGAAGEQVVKQTIIAHGLTVPAGMPVLTLVERIGSLMAENADLRAAAPPVAVLAEPAPIAWNEWRRELAELVDDYIQKQSDGEGDDEAYDTLKAHILKTPFAAPVAPQEKLRDEHLVLLGRAASAIRQLQAGFKGSAESLLLDLDAALRATKGQP